MKFKLLLFCKIINIVYLACRIFGKTLAQHVAGRLIKRLVTRDLKSKFDRGTADFIIGKWIKASQCVQDITRVSETSFIVNRCFFAERVHPDIRHFICLCDNDYWSDHPEVRIIKRWPTIAQGADKCYMEVKKNS